jgi:hypothetical protein
MHVYRFYEKEGCVKVLEGAASDGIKGCLFLKTRK